MIRLLFNDEYLDQGCPEELFVEGEGIDTTKATFITNYVIGFIGLFGLLLWRQGAGWVVYFVATGVGYAVAGIGHQIIEDKDEQQTTQRVLEFLAAVFVTLGICGLCRASLLPWIASTWFHIGLVVLHLAVLAVVVVLRSFLLTGLWLLGVYILSMVSFVAYSCKSKDRSQCTAIWLTVASLLCISGLIVQTTLSPDCGSLDAYRNCFRDCPLPSPRVFNHNAIFHVIFAIGLAMQLILVSRLPTDFAGQRGKDTDDDSMI